MPPVTRKRLKEVADGDSKDSGDASECKKMEANVENPVKEEETIKMRTRRQSLLVHLGKENMTTPVKGDNTGESDAEGKIKSRNRLATPQKKVHNSCVKNSTVSLVKSMSDCELSPAKRKLRRYSTFCMEEKNGDSDTEDEIPSKKLGSCKHLDKKTDYITSEIHSGIDRNPLLSSIAEDEGSGESSVSVQIESGTEFSSEKSALASTQSPISDKENVNLKQLERTPEENIHKVHGLDTSLLQGKGADDINVNIQSESDQGQVGNGRVSVTKKILNLSGDEKVDEDNNEEICYNRLMNPPHAEIITSNEINANVQIQSIAEQIEDDKLNTISILDSNCVEGGTVEVNNIDKIHACVIERPHCKIVKNETSVNGQIESVTEQSQHEKLVNTSVRYTGNKEYKIFERKDNTQNINTSIIIPQNCESVVEDMHSEGVEVELGQEHVQSENSAMTTSYLNPKSIEGDTGNDMKMIDTTQITEKKQLVEYERDDDHDTYDPNFKLRIESSPELNMQEDDLILASERVNGNNVKVDPNTEMSIAVMSSYKGCVAEERLELFREDKDAIGKDEDTYLGKVQQEEYSDEDSGVEASLPPCGQICAENNCSGSQIDRHNRDNIHFEKISFGNTDIRNGKQEPDSELEELYPPSVQLAVQNIGVSAHQSVESNDNLRGCSEMDDEESYGGTFCTGNSDFKNIEDTCTSNLKEDKNIKDLISRDEEEVENSIFDVSGRSDNVREHCGNSDGHNDSKGCEVDENSNSDLKSEGEKFDDSKAKCNGIFSDELSEEEGLDNSDASSEEGIARFSDEDDDDEDKVDDDNNDEEEEDYCEVPRRKVRASQFIDLEAEEGEESDNEEEEEAEEEDESESDEDSDDISEEDPKKLAKMFLNDEAEDEDELKRKKRKRMLIIESDDESEEEGHSSEKRRTIDSCINKTVSCEGSTPEKIISTETSVNENIRSKSYEEIRNEAMTIENKMIGFKNVEDSGRDMFQEAADKINGKEVRPEVNISVSILSNAVDKEARTPLLIHGSSDEKSLAETIATLKNALQITSSKKIMNEASEINLDKVEFVSKEINQDINSEKEINELESQEQHPTVKSNVLEYNLIKNGNKVKNPVEKNKTKTKMSSLSVQKTELTRENREIERRGKIWSNEEVNNADSIRRHLIETKGSAVRVGCMEQTLGSWNVTEREVIKVNGWTIQERKMPREKLKKDIASEWFVTDNVCDRDGPWIVRDNAHTSKGIYKILVKNSPQDWSVNVKSIADK